MKHRSDNVESKALWLICMYTYLIWNVGPHFFMVCFFFSKVGVLAVNFHGFSLMLARVISCDFWPLGKTWYHHTSLSSASLSQRLPILLDIFLEWESWSQPYHMFLYCPIAWSCPQVFNSGLGMRLCEGRFDKEVISCRIVFGIPKLFQTQKSFWHRFKANSFWRNSSASYGEVIRTDENPNRKNVK